MVLVYFQGSYYLIIPLINLHYLPGILRKMDSAFANVELYI